ncbi:MAG: ABC transporter ATP-binding protein [Deltaproteobacteria bacterium]|nr:ABC transporter ATP-binding protein [Deltaproteobacteria bacterium]MBW2151245.1 ABC transporter ATP-binding protein [Deltaproteobacteria bacterium]
MPLLEVRNLRTFFKTQAGYARAVDDISFTIEPGENFGLLGESGCGKTTAAISLIRILPPNGKIMGGHAIFEGRDLFSLSKEEIRKVRWRSISMISQSAMNALDPVYRVGDQIVEVIRTHLKKSRGEAMDRARELFSLVGIDHQRLHDYPHQFSGGMRQRAIIAMALALNPHLIIADEPTTALDVIVQDQILRRISALQKQFNASMIMITHDVSVIAELCERAAVMYAGKIVEVGNISGVLKKPYHPYTMGLKNAFPSILGDKKNLISIPGSPPNLVEPPAGCRFNPRCPFSIDICFLQEPSLFQVKTDQYAACHRVAEADSLRHQASSREIWEQVDAAA